jgi:hypothetical protein
MATPTSKPRRTLISAAELAPHVAAPDWLIVDCRFELGKPEHGEDAYLKGHIPHAIYAHLDRDLAAPITPTSGRHPLPQPEQFASTLTRWGLTPSTQVVAYDADNAAYAARLWWLLRWVGHEAVAVLEASNMDAAGFRPAPRSASSRRSFRARQTATCGRHREVAECSARRLASARRAPGPLPASQAHPIAPVTCRARASVAPRPISQHDGRFAGAPAERFSQSQTASPASTVSCAAPASPPESARDGAAGKRGARHTRAHGQSGSEPSRGVEKMSG